mmetsp:Transcript_23472/g.34641  ORF Transcript_23472/g.34641 Transcript_23472/m.34641 type:complete len:174 (-) Transcript_23472:165-686(-)|eukprot:CAMPEP_0194199606 /NCGR_PEP_ID=MMETSP0156-20130528/568_1 /TAXON_ID=33649 /ORGANISM="Thalassionema nitzschioides, Strain L26-B" /LENGTH=173 /DNA_ID=CAMNT_0038924529 /DNA_START=110 /DNA_END=631 /DNA_ORIENTATION=+
MSPYADASELTIDAEWDNMYDIVSPGEDITQSSKEVCKVLEEWTSDEESVDVDIMEVDQKIGSNFLSDDLFGGVTCPSPVTPQEEVRLNMMDTSCDNFLVPSSDDDKNKNHREAFSKLLESMKRSQETRIALTMKTSKSKDDNSRRQNVTDVLAAIEESGMRLYNCFGPAAGA